MVRNQTLSDHNQINLATFALVFAARERLEIAVSPIKKTTYELLASGLIVEAGGIEPPSRDISIKASTCVVEGLFLASGNAYRQGFA